MASLPFRGWTPELVLAPVRTEWHEPCCPEDSCYVSMRGRMRGSRGRALGCSIGWSGVCSDRLLPARTAGTHLGLTRCGGAACTVAIPCALGLVRSARRLDGSDARDAGNRRLWGASG